MSLKIHGGDFKDVRDASFARGAFTFSRGIFSHEDVKASEIESLEVAGEENTKGFFGTAAKAAIGGLSLGVVGLAAGLLTSGGKDVTFIATFKDGRRLLATADSKTYTAIMAARLG